MLFNTRTDHVLKYCPSHLLSGLAEMGRPCYQALFYFHKNYLLSYERLWDEFWIEWVGFCTNPILPSIPKETFHLTSVSHSHAISSLFPYPCSSSAQPYWMTGSHLILLRPSAFDLYYIKGINSLSLFLSSSVWVCAVVLCRCCSAFFFHRDSKWKGGFGNIKCCLMMAFSWNEMKVGQERRARALGLFFVCGGSIVDWQRNRKIRCQIPFAGNS